MPCCVMPKKALTVWPLKNSVFIFVFKCVRLSGPRFRLDHCRPINSVECWYADQLAQETPAPVK
jgi:hypothetical protein